MYINLHLLHKKQVIYINCINIYITTKKTFEINML